MAQTTADTSSSLIASSQQQHFAQHERRHREQYSRESSADVQEGHRDKRCNVEDKCCNAGSSGGIKTDGGGDDKGDDDDNDEDDNDEDGDDGADGTKDIIDHK